MRRRKEDQTATFEVIVEAIGEKAMLIDFVPFGTGPDSDTWMPLSQVVPGSEIDRNSPIGCQGFLTVKRWIAERKGLLHLVRYPSTTRQKDDVTARAAELELDHV